MGLPQIDRAALERAVVIARELDRRDAQRRLDHMFPDATHDWRGQTYYARDLYPRHMEYFEAQARYREVCALAANRIGKSFGMGGYSVALHLTGLYPDWWPGRRWSKPIDAWAAGKTNETTRDIIQPILLGNVTGTAQDKRMDGTGLIPGRCIPDRPTWRAGVSDLVDTIRVKHVSGGWSTLGLKSYQQGRGAFEGTAKHVVWVDEEPPIEVYGEILIRTATTDGLVLSTWTPVEGMTETTLMFMPGAGDATATAA